MTDGYLRGNLVHWDGEAWLYDDGTPAEDNPRPCPQCHQVAEPNGPDPCLFVLGATGACCGHGIHAGYVSWPGIPAPDGWLFGAWVGEKVKNG